MQEQEEQPGERLSSYGDVARAGCTAGGREEEQSRLCRWVWCLKWEPDAEILLQCSGMKPGRELPPSLPTWITQETWRVYWAVFQIGLSICGGGDENIQPLNAATSVWAFLPRQSPRNREPHVDSTVSKSLEGKLELLGPGSQTGGVLEGKWALLSAGRTNWLVWITELSRMPFLPLAASTGKDSQGGGKTQVTASSA